MLVFVIYQVVKHTSVQSILITETEAVKILLTKRIRYTFLRDSIYYLQFCLPDGKMFRRSLGTDSQREANALMIALMPSVIQAKEGTLPPDALSIQLEELSKMRMLQRATRIFPAVSVKPDMVAPTIEPAEERQITLGEAWKQYIQDKGKHWTSSIHSANERYMEVMLAVLGEDKNIQHITKQDIKQVMEVIEGLPKRVVQPYRSMTIEQLINCDDVPDEHLLGTEAIHKHLKIYKSLFKTYLTNDKSILHVSPTDGLTAPPSAVRYGAYTNSEMKRFVSYAIEEAKPEWLKWIILLLAYTGARRGELATLTVSQVCFDDDSNRHFLLIKEGKTDNAVRQVPLHQHLIELGFLEYVRGKGDKLFPEVAGSNMAKIGKVLSDIRDALDIPYRDIHNQRRIVHSFRHSVVTAASGWMNDITHLQQVIGHEKTGTGITRRYLHTFPLSVVCHIIDGLNWR
ncbi:integrase [Trabulsiella guamensis ATCC 49490]|uniref:Integrase n=1 Tax=Trabulsiella guamensis ATCC 49490 TaxID=1005994 RepID=A0A084ZUB1_9ENTR|nr:integrase [Trabulsiella guamensis ATCC 49490]